MKRVVCWKVKETVEELTRGRVIIERDKDTQVREGGTRKEK